MICDRSQEGSLPTTMFQLPGTPNNQFKMDVWWFPTISYVKIWNDPIETNIYKLIVSAQKSLQILQERPKVPTDLPAFISH